MSKIKTVSISLLVILAFFIGSCVDNRRDLDSAIYFENRYSNDLYTPVVEMTLNGIPQYWIVDTGANMSLVDDAFYAENEEHFTYLNDVDMTLNGVSGTKDYKAYYVLGKLGFSNTTFDQHFLTSDLTGVKKSIKERMGVNIAGILGADYLNRYMFTVDYCNKAVYIHQIPLDTIMKMNEGYKLN